MASKTKGSCLCKGVTYEFTDAPADEILCHCVACKKITGSAFTHNLAVPKPKFTITSGKLASRDFIQEPSGLKLTKHFCPDCGTAIYKDSREEAFASVYLVQNGTVDEYGYEQKGPAKEIWTPTRAAYLGQVKGAAQSEGFA